MGAVLAVAILVGGSVVATTDAEARTQERRSGRTAHAQPPGQAAKPAQLRQASARGFHRGLRRATYVSWGGISCVPYARQITGMEISGNGGTWWYNAAGRYARGQRPEAGAVMAFPGSGGMRAGHVAVVERVLGPREVSIEHANWGGPGIRRGQVMHGVTVVDVSPNNDWSAVRVQVGYDNQTFGRIYPVSGFIYNRPDTTGHILMAGNSGDLRVNVVGSGRAAGLLQLNGGFEELAEQPARTRLGQTGR